MPVQYLVSDRHEGENLGRGEVRKHARARKRGGRFLAAALPAPRTSVPRTIQAIPATHTLGPSVCAHGDESQEPQRGGGTWENGGPKKSPPIAAPRSPPRLPAAPTNFRPAMDTDGSHVDVRASTRQQKRKTRIPLDHPRRCNEMAPPHRPPFPQNVSHRSLRGPTHPTAKRFTKRFGTAS